MEAETEQDFNIYAVEEACGKLHTLLQAPPTLPGSLSSDETIQTHDVFNILMADVSGSMSSYWEHVVTGWQDHIKDKLNGLTKIFVFGSNVQMRRVGSDLYKATPFTDFFAPELNDPEKKKAWLEQYFQGVIEEFESSQGDLLKAFFSLDDLRASIKKFIAQKMSTLYDQILEEIKIGLTMEKIKKLRNFGSCGDIMWPSFKCWADEIGITEEATTLAFSEEQIQVYVCHALMQRNSRDRLSARSTNAKKKPWR
ncbi:hypothetical protein C7M84_001217 [Penaeus vannamei]|uniref:Uncharacterized protein n=1 Tax=Penaeus vannamei TaxID=6689 RepID=A0A3R7MLK1_PENVA|nr:hypothetical protein C7M84_001217 [Penaeus vannamei]